MTFDGTIFFAALIDPRLPPIATSSLNVYGFCFPDPENPMNFNSCVGVNYS